MYAMKYMNGHSSEKTNFVKEILDNGNCGLFFEIGNESKFAEQIIKILNDKELQNKFKERAQKRKGEKE